MNIIKLFEDYFADNIDDVYDWLESGPNVDIKLQDEVGRMWVLHYTTHIRDIVSDRNLRNGVYDMTALAYTKKADDEKVGGHRDPNGGLFFGYEIMWYGLPDIPQKYSAALIRINKGVQIFHEGDSEEQIIFHSDDVKHIIPIIREYDGSWSVGGEIYDELLDAADFALNNVKKLDIKK
jgi:hypothetical protein